MKSYIRIDKMRFLCIIYYSIKYLLLKGRKKE